MEGNNNKCVYCRKTFPDDKLSLTEKGYMCSACLNKASHVVCKMCGAIVAAVDATESRHGGFICKTCLRRL